MNFSSQKKGDAISASTTCYASMLVPKVIGFLFFKVSSLSESSGEDKGKRMNDAVSLTG